MLVSSSGFCDDMLVGILERFANAQTCSTTSSRLSSASLPGPISMTRSILVRAERDRVAGCQIGTAVCGVGGSAGVPSSRSSRLWKVKTTPPDLGTGDVVF